MREVFWGQALSRRDRTKEAPQNDSEIQFQGGAVEAGELLGSIDLHRREVTKVLCRKWQKLLSEAGRGAAEDEKASDGHDILKNSSIRHSWAETNRVS